MNLSEVLPDLIAAQTRMANATAALLESMQGEPAEKSKAAAKKSETTKAAPKKAAPKKEAPAEEPADPKAEAVTLLQVQTPLIQVSKKFGREKARALIADYTPDGEEDLKAVPEENFAALKDAANALLKKDAEALSKDTA